VVFSLERMSKAHAANSTSSLGQAYWTIATLWLRRLRLLWRLSWHHPIEQL
jgi:hypothetical protein